MLLFKQLQRPVLFTGLSSIGPWKFTQEDKFTFESISNGSPAIHRYRPRLPCMRADRKGRPSPPGFETFPPGFEGFHKPIPNRPLWAINSIHPYGLSPPLTPGNPGVIQETFGPSLPPSPPETPDDSLGVLSPSSPLPLPWSFVDFGPIGGPPLTRRQRPADNPSQGPAIRYKDPREEEYLLTESFANDLVYLDDTRNQDTAGQSMMTKEVPYVYVPALPLPDYFVLPPKMNMAIKIVTPRLNTKPKKKPATNAANR